MSAHVVCMHDCKGLQIPVISAALRTQIKPTYLKFELTFVFFIITYSFYPEITT